MQHRDRALLEDAFYSDLYQRHAAGLFAYVYRQTASREDAEDIVLDVFITALQKQDFVTFDEQKQVAWLWTITRHKVVDRFRKSLRQQHVPIELLAESLYEDDEISPERRHLKHEEYAQLHRAIKALPEEQQEVLQLTYYNPAILRAYLQLPVHLDPRILAMAQQATSGAKSMYDMAVDLESYLRTHYTYNSNVTMPPGQEGVSWFLFRSGKQGFCNDFATAMAVMAREMGMPARVVVGYTSGTYDTRTQEWVVRGTDAHAWTQIYFAGYGWINFEPSASFSSFVRPL